MRAVRYHGNHDVRIDTVPEPTCKDDEIEIAPAYVGLCGSDVHEYLAGPITIPQTPHPLTNEAIPIILGHEFSGTVMKLGASAATSSNLKIGDHCVVQPTQSCGSCGACRAQVENCCYQGGFIGLTGGGGGLAARCCVPAKRALALPGNVSLKQGALIEPLAVAHHAVVESGAQAGDSALIIGAGPIGLAVLQILRLKGVENIVVAEVARERMAFAKKLGARRVVDPRVEDVVGEVKKVCEAKGGTDVVFECAGVEAALNAAFQAIRARGTVVNVALWEGPIAFNPNLLLHREARFVGSVATMKADFEAVLEAAGQGRLKLDEMITKVTPLEDVVEGGFEELCVNKERHIKIIVEVAPER